MNKKHTARKAAMLAVTLLLVFAFVFSALMVLGKLFWREPAVSADPQSSKTIVRGDRSYFPRQDITVLLLMGIDEEGPVQSSESYRNTGESDAVVLLILDEQDSTYSMLCLNRDTMVNMPVLGIGGKEAGTLYGQLALSHTYGTGLADSAENTRKAVSEFLYGITIDHYVAVNMDAIAIVNDAVGGVTVNVTEDFSAVDPTLTMGQVTLRGEQALNYVRTRKEVGDQLNLSRMQRHEQYMQGFMKAFGEKLAQSESFAVKAYEDISPYTVTDCSMNVLTGLMNRCSDYTLKEIVSPEGENVLGKEHYEFYADEEALDQLILRLFYVEK